jgi:glycosyltransferase involved in cell wall biosynthesis
LDQSELTKDGTDQSANRPLRILIVVNLAWDSRLGAVRIYAELAERWRELGHTVERFTFSEAFPRASGGGVRFALRQILFPRKAAAYVRQHADRFDVVDALIGSLPQSKERLGFKGLIVARSVGLYRLYDRFEAISRVRWSGQPRGKFLGRIFYAFIKRQLTRDSDSAVHHADVINVPNDEEADCLDGELGSGHRIVVQPYGLTRTQRAALATAAVPTSERLKRPKVSFAGMWGPRKGAYDWGGILRRVWQRHPETRFSFLGVMVKPEQVWADLGLRSSEKIEIVSEYSHDDLPNLLRDCTIGAFPSYAEGFGLAVVEQLAALLPTVAFDVAGPRDIMGADLKSMLVPAGDAEEFARAICRVLEMNPSAYADLARLSADRAAAFDWLRIARQTIEIYRKELAGGGRPILFIQPFSIGVTSGGGGRILRALLENAPFPWKSICTGPQRPPPWRKEVHLAARPFWGRIERTRFARLPHKSARFFERSFRRRLAQFCARENPLAIHTIPHSGLDFAWAQEVARDLDVPFFVSVHDDLAYTGMHEAGNPRFEEAMRSAWQEADARFVISAALGREYSRRYGERSSEIVTDGLKQLHRLRASRSQDALRIYFMGLFHLTYERNLRALLQAVRQFEAQYPRINVTMTCRCAYIRPRVWQGLKAVSVLPYAGEERVEKDMQEADLLYMPIPFGSEHENFARYSVSTKMVTYIGSGLPILYHGPATSAAFEILNRNKAAFFVNTLEPADIAAALAHATSPSSGEVVQNALSLAQREFMLADQTQRFWGAVRRCLENRPVRS